MDAIALPDFAQVALVNERNHAAYVTPHGCDCGQCRWVREGRKLAQIATDQGRAAARDLGRLATDQGRKASELGRNATRDRRFFDAGGMLYLTKRQPLILEGVLTPNED